MNLIIGSTVVAVTYLLFLWLIRLALKRIDLIDEKKLKNIRQIERELKKNG